MEEKVYFSASTIGFYTGGWIEDGSYKTTPDDLIELTDSEKELFWKRPPPDDKQLGSSDGRPVWASISLEQQVSAAVQKKNTLRTAADSEIAWLQDAVDAEIATDEEVALLAEWKKYRIILMRIDALKSPDTDWPTLPSER